MIWIKMAAVSPVIYSSMRPCDRVYKRAFTGDCFFKGGIQFYQFAEYLKPILLMDDMRTKIESYFDEFAEVLLEDDVSEPTSDTQKRYLTKSSIRAMADKVGELLPDEEIEEVLQYATDGDDKIDVKTLLKICKELRLY
uniref:EF-hand domain-containing protein n=2 Tax=Guillardia theta TaxID=55529 RepID=A0A7S4H8U3_GUITH|mmetsp:Transcript_10925/g.36888  ORF Transcript_10925/g.36888 Transcript_10925/m.36888 type:complete len:139 (+) Transcript_10925:286-702(+)